MFAARTHYVASAGWVPIVLAELKDLDDGDGQYKAGITITSTSYTTVGSNCTPTAISGAHNYYSPSGSTPHVWARMSLISGDAPDNTVDSWIDMESTIYAWSWVRVGSGTTAAVVKFQVSTDSGGSNIVLDTGNINVTVTMP
jgi:hypothetical protein